MPTRSEESAGERVLRVYDLETAAPNTKFDWSGGLVVADAGGITLGSTSFAGYSSRRQKPAAMSNFVEIFLDLGGEEADVEIGEGHAYVHATEEMHAALRARLAEKPSDFVVDLVVLPTDAIPTNDDSPLTPDGVAAALDAHRARGRLFHMRARSGRWTNSFSGSKREAIVDEQVNQTGPVPVVELFHASVLTGWFAKVRVTPVGRDSVFLAAHVAHLQDDAPPDIEKFHFGTTERISLAECSLRGAVVFRHGVFRHLGSIDGGSPELAMSVVARVRSPAEERADAPTRPANSTVAEDENGPVTRLHAIDSFEHVVAGGHAGLLGHLVESWWTTAGVDRYALEILPALDNLAEEDVLRTVRVRAKIEQHDAFARWITRKVRERGQRFRIVFREFTAPLDGLGRIIEHANKPLAPNDHSALGLTETARGEVVTIYGQLARMRTCRTRDDRLRVISRSGHDTWPFVPDVIHGRAGDGLELELQLEEISRGTVADSREETTRYSATINAVRTRTAFDHSAGVLAPFHIEPFDFAPIRWFRYTIDLPVQAQWTTKGTFELPRAAETIISVERTRSEFLALAGHEPGSVRVRTLQCEPWPRKLPSVGPAAKALRARLVRAGHLEASRRSPPSTPRAAALRGLAMERTNPEDFDGSVEVFSVEELEDVPSELGEILRRLPGSQTMVTWVAGDRMLIRGDSGLLDRTVDVLRAAQDFHSRTYRLDLALVPVNALDETDRGPWRSSSVFSQAIERAGQAAIVSSTDVIAGDWTAVHAGEVRRRVVDENITHAFPLPVVDVQLGQLRAGLDGSVCLRVAPDGSWCRLDAHLSNVESPAAGGSAPVFYSEIDLETIGRGFVSTSMPVPFDRTAVLGRIASSEDAPSFAFLARVRSRSNNHHVPNSFVDTGLYGALFVSRTSPLRTQWSDHDDLPEAISIGDDQSPVSKHLARVLSTFDPNLTIQKYRDGLWLETDSETRAHIVARLDAEQRAVHSVATIEIWQQLVEEAAVARGEFPEARREIDVVVSGRAGTWLCAAATRTRNFVGDVELASGSFRKLTAEEADPAIGFVGGGIVLNAKATPAEWSADEGVKSARLFVRGEIARKPRFSPKRTIRGAQHDDTQDETTPRTQIEVELPIEDHEPFEFEGLVEVDAATLLSVTPVQDQPGFARALFARVRVHDVRADDATTTKRD